MHVRIAFVRKSLCNIVGTESSSTARKFECAFNNVAMHFLVEFLQLAFYGLEKATDHGFSAVFPGAG
jgi:hypothetical protein